jgi:hypothetical protein
MIKRLTIILAFITIAYNSDAQCDAIYTYAYKGKLVRDSVSDTSKITLLVPSDITFYGNKKTRGKRFYPEIIQVAKGQNEYFMKFTTMGPCTKNYLQKTFIKGIKYYIIKIQIDSREINEVININEIKFTYKADYFEIEIPNIKL